MPRQGPIFHALARQKGVSVLQILSVPLFEKRHFTGLSKRSTPEDDLTTALNLFDFSLTAVADVKWHSFCLYLRMTARLHDSSCGSSRKH